MSPLLDGVPVDKIEIEHSTVEPEPDNLYIVPPEPVILVNGVRVQNYTVFGYGDNITEVITVPYPEGEQNMTEFNADAFAASMNTETELTTEQAHEIVADAIRYEGWTTQAGDSDQAKGFRFDQAMRLASPIDSPLQRALAHLREHVYATDVAPAAREETRSAADIAIDELTAAHAQIRAELLQAIIRTAEYVGQQQLPAYVGWSWYDALLKYAPEEAARFTNPPNSTTQTICFTVYADDPEVRSIEMLNLALRNEPADRRQRILNYLNDRWGEES